MKVIVEINDYSKEDGIHLLWEPGFEIGCTESSGIVLIKANTEGLKSLANHCLTLAQEAAPKHVHIHLDAFNSLEDGSIELIIEKV